jgi:hypothetical protein
MLDTENLFMRRFADLVNIFLKIGMQIFSLKVGRQDKRLSKLSLIAKRIVLNLAFLNKLQ